MPDNEFSKNRDDNLKTLYFAIFFAFQAQIVYKSPQKTVICSFFCSYQRQTCQKCCIPHCFFNHLFKNTGIYRVLKICIKHRKYQQLRSLNLPLQQAQTCKNTDIYSVSEQGFFPKIAILGDITMPWTLRVYFADSFPRIFHVAPPGFQHF